MEVVLLEDVKALGKKGQVVKVNDGYARNFILPKKLGVEATSKNLNDLKLQKANAEKIAAEQLAEAKKLAEEIDKMSVTVSIKAGEGGRAFGSVSTKEEGAFYNDPQTLFLSVEYSRSFGKHYALGAKADIYQYLPGTMTKADGEVIKPGSATSFSFGVYLRVNPSFLIKKFK